MKRMKKMLWIIHLHVYVDICVSGLTALVYPIVEKKNQVYDYESPMQHCFLSNLGSNAWQDILFVTVSVHDCSIEHKHDEASLSRALRKTNCTD